MNNENFEKIEKVLKFVFENQYSDFYRTKYEKAGFNPLSDFNSIDDIEKIPFLTRDELSSVDPSKILFVPDEKIDIVSPTSSTTGKPFFTFHSQYKVPDLPEDKKLGKILVLLNPSRSLLVYDSYKARPDSKNWILMGDIHNIPASCQLAAKLGINTIHTTPTMAVILKDYIDRYPDLKKSLKTFILAGEFVGIEKKNFLQKTYPDLEVFLSYGLSETRRLAFQCQHLAKRVDQVYYHTSRVWDCYLENIDPVTEKKVSLGEKGELVVTTFWNEATPIVRYKTGDLISFRENDCPCGFHGPLLQLWGRKNYDTVKAGGIEFRAETLEKPLLNLKDCIQDTFEVHIYENFSGEKPKIKLLLNLSLNNGQIESVEIKQKIEKEFLENWQLSPKLNLGKAIESGICERPQINFVDFPKSAKTKKVLILH